MSDDIADKILQRIATGNSSHINLSDSDQHTIADPSFFAPLGGLGSEKESTDDGGPSTPTSKQLGHPDNTIRGK